MTEKTDLSREFGSYECAQQEFGSKAAALEPKTDLSVELSPPLGAEFGEASPEQEFSRDDAAVEAPPPSRRERHRQTLLLQMAAAALAVVLVTSSFGKDILGDDMLFSGAAAPTEPTSESTTEGTAADSNALETITTSQNWDDSRHVIYVTAANDQIISLYNDTLRYNTDSNTLYLRGCSLNLLEINMSRDITIYVEENSSLGHLRSDYCGVILDGEPGAVLEINKPSEEIDDVWSNGFTLRGENTSLTVKPGIIVDIYGGNGDPAVNMIGATAPAIRYDDSRTTVNGALRQKASECWTIVDETGEPAQFVRFAPIGYEPPDSGDNSDWNIVVREAGKKDGFALAPGMEVNGVIDLGTLRYNANSRTLYLKGCDLEYLGIQVADRIQIYVEKDSSVGHLVSEHGTSVYLDGVPGAVLEIDSNNRWLFGIHMYGTGGNTRLNVGPGIIVEVSGGTRGAIGIGDTTASPAICYDESQTAVTGTVQSGEFDLFRNTSLYADLPEWTVIDETGEPAQFVRFAPIGYEAPTPDETQ